MSAYSVVVVSWESGGHLRSLVESMNRHLGAAPELIVVDNASTDNPSAAVRSWEGEGRLIAQEKNIGFGAAANAGVAAASNEAVVLLNPDTVLVDSSLDDLVGVALRKGALAGPRLLNPDRSPQPSASGSPVGAWPWIGAVVPGALAPPPIRARTEPWRLDRTTRVAWLTGACVAAPTDVLRALGPFDPAIHLYAEDMDLGLRAASAGVASFFCPNVCRVVHQGGASSAMLFPDGSQLAVATNRRTVLRRAYGDRREHRAWLALRLNLRLRVLAKIALRRDATGDRLVLGATRRAPTAPASSADHHITDSS